MKQIVLALAISTALTAPAFAQKQSMAIYDATASENDGKLPVKVCKVGPNRQKPVDVHLNVLGVSGDTAKAGVDFVPIEDLHLSFAPADLCRTTDLQLIDDALPEPTKFVTGTITAGKNARLYDGKAKLTITDPDVITPTPIPCPDGSTVIPPATCPTPPPVEPPPTPGDIFVPSLAGLPPVVVYPDPSGGLETWSYEKKTAAPDVLGAVRLTCGFAGVGYFDPKVFPGDHTGKSHLHQFYGNVSVTPDSTYESLRLNGKSTCNYGDVTVQRSAYWQPAMLDGKGNVVQPDHTTLYYKRRPLTDPVLSDPSNPKYQGKGVDWPNGLFYIFGYDLLTDTPPTGGVQFNCYPPNGAPAIAAWNIADIAATGQCIAGSQFVTRGEGPSCWDGKRADSANHRDHVSYPQYGSWGYPKCDAAHPFVIPTVTLLSSWIIQPGDDLKLWFVSSDTMRPTLKKGSTIHFDIWPLWEPAVLKLAETGTEGCIEGMLNCSSGRLTTTIALKNAGQPQYPDPVTGKLVKSWTNPRRLIPVPGPEANAKMIGFEY